MEQKFWSQIASHKKMRQIVCVWGKVWVVPSMFVGGVEKLSFKLSLVDVDESMGYCHLKYADTV